MDTNHPPTSRPGRCRLTLTINGLHDTARPVVSQDDDVSRAFRLGRQDVVFNLAQTTPGIVCDCPGLVFRRDGRDPRGRLHIRAMLAVGLPDQVLSRTRRLSWIPLVQSTPFRGNEANRQAESPLRGVPVMITFERLKDLRPADPFVPFVPHLTDGRRSPVSTHAPFEVSPDLVQAAEGPIERPG